MATLKYATVPISESAAKYCRRWSPTVTLIPERIVEIGDRLSSPLHPIATTSFSYFRFTVFASIAYKSTISPIDGPVVVFTSVLLFRRPAFAIDFFVIIRSTLFLDRCTHDCRSDGREIAVSSLRTARRTEAERAENYVECVRSVAGGVYFVMQINARLPNHPLLHPCTTTATPSLSPTTLRLSLFLLAQVCTCPRVFV